MARLIVSLLGGLILISLALCEVVVWRQMIDAVNRGRGHREQFSKWWHTPITLQTVWRTYRTMHPESSLPLAYLLSAAGIVVCVLVFGLAESWMR